MCPDNKQAVVNFPSSDESPGNSLGDETADRLQWGLPTLSLPHDGSFAFDSSIKFAEPSSPAMMPASAPEQQVSLVPQLCLFTFHDTRILPTSINVTLISFVYRCALFFAANLPIDFIEDLIPG